MDVRDVQSARRQSLAFRRRDIARLVGGVVQHLDLELLVRIVELGHGLQKPAHDVVFIEERQLHGDGRQLLEMALRLHIATYVLEKEIDDRPPVNAVCRQTNEHAQVTGAPDKMIKNRFHRIG